jgi:hypothetical protein
MRKINILWLVITLLQGCNSSRVVSYLNEDIDLGRLKTFALTDFVDQEKLNRQQQQMDSVLLEVMMRQMRFRGYEPSFAPDMFVGYQVVLNRSSESRLNDTYGHYSNRSYYYSPYDYHLTTTSYLEGVMIVEVKSPNGKLIWQGSKEFKTSKRASTPEILRQTLLAIIATFPEHN